MTKTESRANWWPYVVYGGYGLFACIAIGGAILLSRSRVDLVSADYYAQQIGYEGRLNAMRAASLPGHAFQMGLIRDGVLEIQRPSAPAGAITGTACLYRPSDPSLDLSLPLTLSAGGAMSIPVKGLKSGSWRLKLEWEVEKTAHYQEISVNLP
ncbi:MAG: FixH family protein [Kiritimatiellia bacterium]